MTDVVDRILTMRHVTCMAALDSMPHIITRVRELLSHGRRISIARHYLYSNGSPTLDVGLHLHETRSRISDRAASIGVHLKPGLKGFAIGASAGQNDTETGEWKRYHADDRLNMTEVTINGGLPCDGPCRDDKLTIRAWNSAGVCDEFVIGFDYGPDGGMDRLARHMYLTAVGNDPHAVQHWDSGAAGDSIYRKYEQQAEAAIRVYEGREG